MKKLSFNYFFILSILFLNSSLVFAAGRSFNENWSLMQKEYAAIVDQYNLRKFDNFCHSQWKAARGKVGEIINGKPNRNFLYHQEISPMVRLWSPSKFEEAYLVNCLSDETKLKLSKFKDVDKSWLPHESVLFDCSTNTLGQLYYAAKIFENCRNKKINTIVEFGGGYGCLSRILKMMDPELTIIIIDLPEFTSLQGVFLRETLGFDDVVVHCEAPKEYEKGKINLVPACFLEDINLNADVFVSNFGLSEVEESLQAIVVKKNFFNAPFCFITGQYVKPYNWEVVFKGLRSIYSEVLIHPFHIVLHSYELSAKNGVLA